MGDLCGFQDVVFNSSIPLLLIVNHPHRQWDWQKELNSCFHKIVTWFRKPSHSDFMKTTIELFLSFSQHSTMGVVNNEKQWYRLKTTSWFVSSGNNGGINRISWHQWVPKLETVPKLGMIDWKSRKHKNYGLSQYSGIRAFTVIFSQSFLVLELFLVLEPTLGQHWYVQVYPVRT